MAKKQMKEQNEAARVLSDSMSASLVATSEKSNTFSENSKSNFTEDEVGEYEI